METLHLIRSVPDAMTENLITELSNGCSVKTLKLYETEIDWENVVDLIFSHDHVICWW
jgi:hypothetical protein